MKENFESSRDGAEVRKPESALVHTLKTGVAIAGLSAVGVGVGEYRDSQRTPEEKAKQEGEYVIEQIDFNTDRATDQVNGAIEALEREYKLEELTQEDRDRLNAKLSLLKNARDILNEIKNK